ncbi:MAG: FAD:protein FMN transferase [Pseudomonadota bacterium]
MLETLPNTDCYPMTIRYFSQTASKIQDPVRFFTATLLTVLLTSATAAMPEEPQPEACVSSAAKGGYWWRSEAGIMGTRVHVELWLGGESTTQKKGCAAIKAVMDEMRRIDRAMSPYKDDSELSRMNKAAVTSPFVLTRELFAIMAVSEHFATMTQGAFDVTYASAGRLYDYRGGVKPDHAQLEDVAEAIDYRHVVLNPANRTVQFRHPGVHVDLGGIAKGYAVDRGIAVLQRLGITQAMVSAGGDSRILGDRLGEPWVVGVKHPRSTDDNIAVLPLEDVAISTSGDYERYFEAEGIRYHHIIDPSTGDSARRVASVTILGSETMETDALSTSVFVMGIEQGLRLINRLDNIDAIIVDDQGRLFMSDTLQQLQPAPLQER